MEQTWDLPPEDPALTEPKLGWVRTAGAHVMGRVTYEEMASAWPNSSHAYAAPMNEIPTVVFSQTLERADWPDSKIVRGDFGEGVAGLKRAARADVIDEYRLTTHPIAIGKGLPLLKDLPRPRPAAGTRGRVQPVRLPARILAGLGIPGRSDLAALTRYRAINGGRDADDL